MQTSIAVKRAAVVDERRAESTETPRIQLLFEQEYPAVVRHLVYLTGDIYLAEDLAQDAFGKLMDRGPTDDLTNPRAWLLTVASNLACNTFRSETRRSERESTTRVQPGSDPAEQVAIRDALARLEPRDRAILMLKHAGFSYAEIAEAVDVKPSSVGTTLARAQARFRELYGHSTSAAANPAVAASPRPATPEVTGE